MQWLGGLGYRKALLTDYKDIMAYRVVAAYRQILRLFRSVIKGMDACGGLLIAVYLRWL